MTDDFDEDTLETISPIIEMRKQKRNRTIKNIVNEYKQALIDGKDLEKLQRELKDLNVFVISRDIYDKTPNENIEAWFTKFDDVIINDTERPYKKPLNKKELGKKILSKMTIQNLNKGIDKFNKGVNEFSKVVASSNNTKSSDLSGLKSKKKGWGMSKKEYDNLFGPPKKRKGKSVSFWDEDRPTRKRRNKRAAKPKETDYSALIGKKRMKFF